MTRLARLLRACAGAAGLTLVLAPVDLSLSVGTLAAQAVTTNPFRPTYGWGRLPAGRAWGSTSAIDIGADGNIWVAERCGANTCVGSTVDPVLLFRKDGTLVRSFGAGLIAWPHGMAVDRDGNVWVADAWAQGAKNTGHTVLKFSPEGTLLMTIGEPGVAGDPPQRLTRPSDVLVAPSGEIYIVEAHNPSRNRMTKWAADGRYLETWGEAGDGPKQFRDPHALAIDSRGRIFVGDRNNNRIQIFDPQGHFIAAWGHFGRPSGIFIDRDDRIYVADSEASPALDRSVGMRNAGWQRGIRVGSARTGSVDDFLPDERANVGPEGVAVDSDGSIYGAEVSQPGVTQWRRLR